jgi:choline dehydrogenase
VELARSVAAEVPLKALATGEVHPGTAPMAEAIRAGTSTYHHPVGTCRMGPFTDPRAVVDGEGRVHGAGSLRVVDASIMPSIRAANTNLPTINGGGMYCGGDDG